MEHDIIAWLQHFESLLISQPSTIIERGFLKTFSIIVMIERNVMCSEHNAHIVYIMLNPRLGNNELYGTKIK